MVHFLLLKCKDNGVTIHKPKSEIYPMIWIDFMIFHAIKIIKSICLDNVNILKTDDPCDLKLWLMYYFTIYLHSYRKKLLKMLNVTLHTLQALWRFWAWHWDVKKNCIEQVCWSCFAGWEFHQILHKQETQVHLEPAQVLIWSDQVSRP